MGRPPHWRAVVQEWATARFMRWMPEPNRRPRFTPGSPRHPCTLLRTEDGALIRMQRPARERLQFSERVDEGFDAVPVAVRPAG